MADIKNIKVVDAEQLNAALDDLAESIRTKSGVKGDLAFPDPNEFKSAVDIIDVVKNETKPETITSNGNHPTGGYSNVDVDVPVGITPIGNLTDALITRASASDSHKATLPAGYYVNSSFTISEWKAGQITGSGTNGKAFTIPYSSIGFIPKWVILFLNSATMNANTVLYFFSNGSASRCAYMNSMTTTNSSSSYNATINTTGVTFPTPGSSIKYSTNNYRWFALR